MKTIHAVLILFMLSACGKSDKNQEKQNTESTDTNQALYEQVMDVHDEVMPKVEQLYSLKKELQEKLKTKDLPDDVKKQIDLAIHGLDSADRAMMNWMHHFNPLPDSANREAAREYLEDEMEKIKNVRELTYSTIQKAKEELGKK
ncbi:MAG: hypothetical protein JSS93_10885 [Bacteroidetes bacterium]|nr:hypothetical protein [Bacteroidota bacterium]